MAKQTIQEIKIGDVGVIVRSKHCWNNGKKVVIDAVNLEKDEYPAHLVSNPRLKYILGAKNFQFVN